jgi:hypothetical protein
MADESVASIIPWHQPKPANTDVRTGDRSGGKPVSVTKPRKRPAKQQKPKASAALDDERLASETLISPDFLELVREQSKSVSVPERARVDWAGSPKPNAASRHAPAALPASTASLPALPVPQTPPTPPLPALASPAAATTPQVQLAPRDEHAGRPSVAPMLLRAAAFALAGVGMAMNGWYAQSLGSSHVAGWMFLAIGVAADLVALVMPSCAARLWHARHYATALAGWAVWTTTFVFAVTAGIGFASTNISEVALARSSRVTPAVQTAQAQLTDAMAARDRECKGGVGKFCREREAAVVERRQALDTAMASVAQTADPQTLAAIKLVAWLSHGLLKPEADDFAMLRLVLLALLPQFGGILLMVGRRA